MRTTIKLSILAITVHFLSACGSGVNSEMQEEVPINLRVDAFYQGYAECTGDPSLTTRTLPSKILGLKLGSCTYGQLV